MATATPKCFVVGGLALNVYGLSSLSPSTSSAPPIAILFHLHGRFSSHAHQSIPHFANSVLAQTVGKKGAKKELLVVTFDQRNHGERLVEQDRNRGWNDGKATDSPENLSHAVDMISIQSGTAADVSHLIGYLPAALFPNDERTVTDWYVSGTSLGGHAAWIVASKDPRVTLTIPIIGSPSALTLLSHRAQNIALPLGPLPVAAPYFPKSLIATIESEDPSNQPSTVWKNKKVLVLSGAVDPLVNYVDGGSEAFVAKLREWNLPGLEVATWVQDGIGHTCTDEMIAKAAEWVWEKGLSVAEPSCLVVSREPCAQPERASWYNDQVCVGGQSFVMGLFGHKKERTPEPDCGDKKHKGTATPPHRNPVEYEGGVSLFRPEQKSDLVAGVTAGLSATPQPPKYQYPLVTPPSEAERVVEQYRSSHHALSSHSDTKHSIMVVQVPELAKKDSHVQFATQEPVETARAAMYMERFSGDPTDKDSWSSDGDSYLDDLSTISSQGRSTESESSEESARYV